jgi:hypothetical protein
MSTFKRELTTRECADRYQVSPDDIRTVVDRVGLGHRLGRWRVIPASELGRLEDALLAIGRQIPADLPPVEELEVAEEPQPVAVEEARS